MDKTQEIPEDLMWQVKFEGTLILLEDSRKYAGILQDITKEQREKIALLTSQLDEAKKTISERIEFIHKQAMELFEEQTTVNTLRKSLEEVGKERDDYRTSYNRCFEDLNVVRENGQKYKAERDKAREEAATYRKALDDAKYELSEILAIGYMANVKRNAMKVINDALAKYPTNNPNTKTE